MELKHEETTNRNRFYLLDEEKEVGEITYVYVKDHILNINHTEINDNFRGQGLGEKLIDAVVDFARKKEIHVSASCTYAKKVLEETNKYDDVKA